MFDIKYISTFIILFSLISLIAILTIPRVKRRQKNSILSLQEGFGYYTPEISLGCISESGNCTDEGVEKTVQYCKPHPATGRGCIDENGRQNFKTIVKEKPCRLQCYSSDFTIQDGVKVLNDAENLQGTSFGHTVLGLGCDRVIDKNLGIDYTDYFFGDFTGDKYPLKSCIPNNEESYFQTYYQKIYTCRGKDQKGENLCSYTCGEGNLNILNLTGFTEAGDSKSLLNYFPYEIDEEGRKRFICYDINDKNVIESLNYEDTVPEDFVYPDKCYKHSNVLNFNESIWPSTGVSNVFNLDKNQVSENISYIDIKPDQYTNFKYILGENGNKDPIISSDYDINISSNSYVKLRFGNQLALLDKIFPETTSGIDVKKSRKTAEDRDNNNIESKFMYLAFKSYEGSCLNTLYEGLSSGINARSDFILNPLPIPLLDDENQGFYNNNINVYKDKYYFIEDEYLYFPCNFSDLFYYADGESNVIYNGVSTFVSNKNFNRSGDVFCYMISKGVSGNTNEVKFLKGTADSVTSTAVFDGKIFDKYSSRLEDLYIKRSWENLIDDKQEIISYKTIPYILDYSRSFMTFNVVMNEFQTEIQAYDYVEIKDRTKIVEGNETAYTVLGTPQANTTTGYYFPLYLNNSADRLPVVFLEFPNLQFYLPGLIEDVTYSIARPQYYENTPLVLFNEEILFSSAKYSKTYIKFNDDTRKYFISDLDTINHGMSYEKGPRGPNRIYPLFSNVGSSFNNLNNISSNLNIYKEKDQITNSVAFKGGGDYTGSRTIKIIRGNSDLVQNTGLPEIINLSKNSIKINDYFEIIRFQDFSTDLEEELIFEPEKNLTLLANYEEFKSPYTLAGKGIKDFICFDSNGKPLPNGTVKTFSPGEKIYLNLSCPNDDIGFEILNDENPYCGVKGIKSGTCIPDESGVITLNYCVQDRNSAETNFTGVSGNEGCIVSKDLKKYNTLNNQFSHGFELREIFKGLEFYGVADNEIRTFPSYFTRIFKENKLYQPLEEFYIEKLRNNYYISLVSNNQTFIDNIETWKRSFIYTDNILSLPNQSFFNVFPQKSIENTINVSLGKFSDTYGTKTSPLTTQVSNNMYLGFTTENTGLTTQNYLNQGVFPYWGHQRKPLYTKPPLTYYNSATSFIANLVGSLYRKRYENPTFVENKTDNRPAGPNPEWSSVKLFQNPTTKQYFLTNDQPVLVTFGIEKLDKFVFRSRFYDSNLDTEWANDTEVGDFFTTDFTYFNSFIYSFILSQKEHYGGIGSEMNRLGDPSSFFYNLTILDELEPLFLKKPEGDMIFSNPGCTKINISQDSLLEEEDFVIFIPYSPVVETSNPIHLDQKLIVYNFENIPYTYPTLIIRRVSSITPGGQDKSATFEDKNYSGYDNTDLTENAKFYIFNMGKPTDQNNFIDRLFTISSVRTFIEETKFSEYDNTNINYTVSKKYIEFFFNIPSINQTIMSQLYNEYIENKQISELTNLFAPQSQLTPAISCKYIKSKITTPSYVISPGKIASLSNTSEQDILNTKVMSQSTRIRLYEGSYYISEFRENINYFKFQEKRTFEVGDVFDYYNSVIDPYTGNQNFINVLTLKVMEVDVTLKDEDENVNIYDYRCLNINLQENIKNPFEEYEDKQFKDKENLLFKNFFLYSKSIDLGASNWEYQLPYTVYKNNVLYQRAIVKGVRSDFLIDLKYYTAAANSEVVLQDLTSVKSDSLFLDYYKFNNDTGIGDYIKEPNYNNSNLGAVIPWLGSLKYYQRVDRQAPYKSLAVSTLYSGSAIRAGLLDTMVLTKTIVTDTQSKQNFLVNLDVKGKPYGPSYFLSQPSTSPMINYQSFGLIKSISFEDTINNMPKGDVLKSNKGFEIKISIAEPVSYLLESCISPYQGINLYQDNYSYLENDIVNIKNNNSRQYLRNDSGYTLPYLEKPDVSSGSIPYAVKDNKWYYPLYLSNNGSSMESVIFKDTTFYYEKGSYYNTVGDINPTNFMSFFDLNENQKLEALSNFSVIPKTFFQEDNFVNYSPESLYVLGELVLGEENGEKNIYRSINSFNIGNDLSDIKYWEKILNSGILQNDFGNNFYNSLEKNNNYEKYIENIKNLNNQNLPALIQDYENNEFCPKNCTYYGVCETYENTFLGVSYFDNIRYLFESPVILKIKDTNSVLSLGNSPVPYKTFYKTNFLENGGGAGNYLSQYLYFLDIEGEEVKYGKEGCSGNLIVTKKGGPSINTGVNKFTFANSLIFNFIPCDEDGQDFIKYNIDSGSSSGTSILLEASDNYVSSGTRNIFPPNGVSCNVIVSSENGSCFRAINGHFQHSYVLSDTDDQKEIPFGTSFIATVTRGDIFYKGVSGSGCCYGDLWFNHTDDTNYSSGFIIPRNDGSIEEESFIYLTENSKLIGDTSTIPERDITFPNKNSTNKIQNFTLKIEKNEHYSSGNYESGGTCFYIQTYGEGSILQQKQSLFITTETINNGEVLYLPTYDITKNIKIKTKAILGDNYLGYLNYQNSLENSVYTINGERTTPVMFKQSKNDMLLADDLRNTTELFLGDSKKIVTNLNDTIIINFEDDTFSFSPNLYQRPIINKDNKFLYSISGNINPKLPLTAINSESTTIFTGASIKNMIGLSLHVDFKELFDYQLIYDQNGPKIPGKSNIQVQFSEIRENLSQDYIQKDNVCSLYFDPQQNQIQPRHITDILIMKFQGQNGTYYSTYGGGMGSRFNGSFTYSNITLDYASSGDTLQLGCNLLYIIDQTDITNLPLVFSKTPFSNIFETNDIQVDANGKEIFEIKYLLNNTIVTYDDYIKNGEFGKIKNRKIEIMYRSSFDVIDFSKAIVYYGDSISGSSSGGRIKFNYH